MAQAYYVKCKKKVEIQNAKTIESKDGEAILVRPMSWRDLGKLRDMHSRCSPETLRLDGTATLTEPRPSVTQVTHLLKWVLFQSKLLLSSIGWIRSFLAVFPRGAYLLHVAVNGNNEIVGFRIHNILGRTRNKKYIVESMTVLRDDYQGKGLGPNFIVATLEMISPSVELVCSEIRRTNIILGNFYKGRLHHNRNPQTQGSGIRCASDTSAFARGQAAS